MIYFIHIPHTGGRSICTALTKIFPDHQCIHHTSEIEPGKEFVYGHTHPLPPQSGLFQFAFLRHPVHRIVSHYCYVRDIMEGPSSPLKSGYMNIGLRWPMPLEGFVTYPPFENIENGMIKQLAGLPCVNEPGNSKVTGKDYQTALGALKKMDLVGVTEAYEDGFWGLFQRFGLALPRIPHEGESQNKPDYDQCFIDFVLDKNSFDAELYYESFELPQAALTTLKAHGKIAK